MRLCTPHVGDISILEVRLCAECRQNGDVAVLFRDEFSFIFHIVYLITYGSPVLCGLHY
jgi:hypothetical protein